MFGISISVKSLKVLYWYLSDVSCLQIHNSKLYYTIHYSFASRLFGLRIVISLSIGRVVLN